MEKLQLIKVSDNKRFLVKEDGTPFFWLGDTAWELFHRLNREEAELYLKNRAERKFNVIQAVALGELEGVTIANLYGRKPLLQNSQGEYDPTMPDLEVTGDDNYTYWDHVDYIVDKAAEFGLYIGFLPTWGDKYNKAWGKGPEIFNGENAKAYGKWLGERYKDKTNIIWIMGGDRPLVTAKHFDVINSMAQGIKEGDEGRHLITFHPCGGTSSSHHNHDEKWLDFNMIQSGHGALNLDNYKMVTDDYLRVPVKPTLDGEPRYEDHPIGFNPTNGYFDDFDVRQATYWAVFAGGFGHTYGHHSIWCMCTEPADYFIMHWKEAITRPGAWHMQFLVNLIESRPFLERVPDQELIAENYNGANHLQATRGESYAFIYSPNGLNIKVNMGRISGDKVKAQWYDPRTGETSYIGELANEGVQSFMPPSSGRKNDWVLILDDASEQ
jgi:hypothetical protein